MINNKNFKILKLENLFYIILLIFILGIFYFDQKNKDEIRKNNKIEIIQKYYIKNGSSLNNHEIAKICIDNRLFLYTQRNLIQVFDDNQTIVKCK